MKILWALIIASCFSVNALAGELNGLIKSLNRDYVMLCSGEMNGDVLEIRTNTDTPPQIQITYSESADPNHPQEGVYREFPFVKIENADQWIQQGTTDPSAKSGEVLVTTQFTNKLISLSEFFIVNQTERQFQRSIELQFNDETLSSGIFTKTYYAPETNKSTICSFWSS